MSFILNFFKRPEAFASIAFLSLSIFPLDFTFFMAAVDRLYDGLQIITKYQAYALVALIVFKPFYTFALTLLAPPCGAIVAIASCMVTTSLCIYAQRKWIKAHRTFNGQ